MRRQEILEEKNRIIRDIKEKLKLNFAKTLDNASLQQMFEATAMTVRDRVMDKWLYSKETAQKQQLKQLYYLSVEYLPGRTLFNNIINLLATEPYQQAIGELGFLMEDIEEQESDAGLGNGGLGRLAACIMDGLSVLKLPAMGLGIRFEYGLFKQRIVDGTQVEMPDSWLDGGNVWEIPAPEESVEVRFGGIVDEVWSEQGLYVQHTGYTTVLAVPYDVPISGYGSEAVSTLRLWSAKSPVHMDMSSFSRGDYIQSVEAKELAEVITKVLYPEDNHYEGKALRLKQHYFFASASIQYILNQHVARYGDVRTLPEKVVIQINDTHPSFAIPELIRLLTDVHKLKWEEALDISRQVFAYTNHTVLHEALERWPLQLVKDLLPRITSILYALNEEACKRYFAYYPDQWDRIGNMAIISYDQVQMANLCVAVCKHVNGVSQLHGDILKNTVFRDAYLVEPWKYLGITNGVTHRRWVLKANGALCDLLRETIGMDWVTDASELNRLMPYTEDAAFREQFEQVKLYNKRRLCDYLLKWRNVHIDPESIFDMHCKRLHEYKRQLLNMLHILLLYQRIDSGERPDAKRTFFFGAKASPGYHRAKLIIQLINAVAELVDRHPVVSKYVKVVFIENYNITKAESLICAADVSEQLSTAGKEASGTGNMKFMFNGAVTLGTMDGANVEIFEQVGEDNIFIFGASAQATEQMSATGDYSPGAIYAGNAELHRVMDMLIDGTLSRVNEKLFYPIYHELLFGDGGAMADRYFVLNDFQSYADAHESLADAYLDRNRWLKMSITNTARAGMFAIDRTVSDYNKRIWRLEPIRFEIE